MKKPIILSIVIVIILLTSIIFLYNQNRNLENDILALNNNIAELNKTTIKENNNNSDLEIYENKEYNYIISYPKTANIENIDLNQCGSQCIDAKALFYGSSFNIFVYKKPTETNLAEYADNIFKNSVASVQSTKWIDVAEQKGYQVTASVDYSIIYTFIINGDYLYEINVINPDEESLKTYDNLLGSFRFTE